MKIRLYVFYTLFICLAFCNSTIAQNANTSLSNLDAPVKINASLLPDKANKHNLGSAAKRWENLYIDSAVYIAGSKFLSSPGLWNTATGFTALAANAGGINNTANGFLALYHNTSGSGNSSFGSFALSYNTTGSSNAAFGVNALYLNTGDYNSALGANALAYNSTGYYNSALGYNALASNTTGTNNSALGSLALTSNTTGTYNTATGAGALGSNVSGYYNTANGDQALRSNTNGDNNTAVGAAALSLNATGIDNSAVGFGALYFTSDSWYNTAVGYHAGYQYNNGYNNVFLGANTDVNGAGYYNDVAIGQGTICTDVSQVRLGNSTTASIGGYAGWTNISDGRVKKNIRQNVPGLAFINKLQPVTYNLDLDAADKIIQYQKKDSAGKIIERNKVENDARLAKEKITYTGFIAQDVEKAARSMNYDFSGVDAAKNSKDLYGIRYAEFVVPLVKAVQELSEMNDVKDRNIDSLRSEVENIKWEMENIKLMLASNQPAANVKLQTANPSFVSLSQNFPNPFSNSTAINYSLPQTYSLAKIIITNNKEISLKEINLNVKGKGSVNINASTLSAGAYQYSLYVDGKLIDTKQMILAK